MPSITISKEAIEDIMWSSVGPSDSGAFIIVHEGEWTQDGKCQYQEIIFKNTGDTKCYSFNISRSGSPFTDWHYDTEYMEEMTCTEVEEVEIITKMWRAVK